MDTAIVSMVAAILGALAGGWITYRFALDLAKRQMFNQAATLFRAAFTDELTKLTTTFDDTLKILKAAQAKHVAAVFNFRWVLAVRERERFDSAWQKYYCANQNPQSPYLEKYSESLSYEQSGIPKQERRRTAIDRIEELLRLAEPK